MTASTRDCMARLLETYRPATLLVIGEPPTPPETPATTTCLAASAAPSELAELRRFDFAIVSGLVERLDAPDASAVLGRLKNFHTDRFVLVADPVRAGLGHDALLALALAPYEQLADGLVAWLYDIDRYNPERPWNNPEDWANPGNFERFRW
jgi:hypothetical protein